MGWTYTRDRPRLANGVALCALDLFALRLLATGEAGGGMSMAEVARRLHLGGGRGAARASLRRLRGRGLAESRERSDAAGKTLPSAWSPTERGLETLACFFGGDEPPRRREGPPRVTDAAGPDGSPGSQAISGREG